MTLNMSNYDSSHYTEVIGGETYDIWSIQLNNYSGSNDLNIVVDNLKNLGNPAHKKQVRIYISGNLNMSGNASIQAVDGNSKPNRITGSTAQELEQISALRIIGGSASGTQPTSQNWSFQGTTCTMGMIHAPVATLTYSGGGNGCGNAGGEKAIDLNKVSGVSGSFGNTTPNHFGAMWVGGLVPNNSNALAFFENTRLSELLALEFGSTNFVGGGGSSSSVNMGATILSMTRQAVN